MRCYAKLLKNSRAKTKKIVQIFKKENIEISLDVANECIEYLEGIEVLEDDEFVYDATSYCKMRTKENDSSNGHQLLNNITKSRELTS